jgi:hypothetical protein
LFIFINRWLRRIHLSGGWINISRSPNTMLANDVCRSWEDLAFPPSFAVITRTKMKLSMNDCIV